MVCSGDGVSGNVSAGTLGCKRDSCRSAPRYTSSPSTRWFACAELAIGYSHLVGQSTEEVKTLCA